MQTITFNCETITPMFLAGADGTTPELRAPSIKGALRFWWRATNGHLSLDDMKKAEGEIFGSTSQRSKVIIREPQETDEYSHLKYDKRSEAFMLPHKPTDNQKSSVKCFPNKDTSFQIQFMMLKDISVKLSNNATYSFSFTDLCNLFKAVCILGGFGKRSRRGFGSVKITRTMLKDAEWQTYTPLQPLKEIEKLLGNRFTSNGSVITVADGVFNYPYIKTIELGVTDGDITKKIINDSHLVKLNEMKRVRDEDDYKKDYRTGDYRLNKKNEKIPNSRFDDAIGNGGRFASPIFVSTIETSEGLKSIITTLKAVPNNRYDESTHGVLQTEYKDKLKKH